jgi:HPt (histidine-containing phosphotransfer) domain-containing protein
MREKNTYKEVVGSQECQESLQQFQTVVSSLLTMTRQLMSWAGTIDVDALDNALEERRQLLGVAQTLRDKFVQWKHEQRVSDQLKQYVMPLVSELFHADEQLMFAVQQRKHVVVEELARLHRVHNVERYMR